MRPKINLAVEFVEFIPENLRESTLYISQTYGTAIHKCCCGCGREVVTPLSPTGWELTIDAEHVSLSPSIGSWSLPCQSHYFITNNTVEWAPQWSQQRIDNGRALEAKARDRYYAEMQSKELASDASPVADRPKNSFWKRAQKILFFWKNA